jgi:predicted ATPase
MSSINPNSDKDFINNLDITKPKAFPKFIRGITLNPFRHISDLDVEFQHPISVISGTNKSGKSTILMALACSHFDFQKRNTQNGKLERQTWSSIMKFTNHDRQQVDWNYFINYKTGSKLERSRGQRKYSTKKWNGIAKKESQFKDRQSIFIDLDRITPARNFNNKIFSLAKNAVATQISAKTNIIEGYISYVLEQNISLQKIAAHLDKDIFTYIDSNNYSSYNAATGEEVLLKIILDIVEAKKGSLILIDEIEIGLHPKVQRRLMDVIYNIARNEDKQFIITTHSPSILSSVPEKSRIFIEKGVSNTFKAIPNISVNAALSKMDSCSYPLFDLYCEDNESKSIIYKAITGIQINHQQLNFHDLVNVIVSGSASQTYTYFKSHKETYPYKRIKTGYACILDGDRRNIKDSNNALLFPPEECIHFIYSNECPEYFLLENHLQNHPNTTLRYHLDNCKTHSNPHILFDKVIENTQYSSKEEVFNALWEEFIATSNGNTYFEELKEFLLSMARKYSPDL